MFRLRKILIIKLQGNQKYQRLLATCLKRRGLRCGYVNLKPDERIGEHSTDSREEVIIILAGKAGVSCGKSSALLSVQRNSVVYIPARTKHNVKNTGRKILRYVYITK